MKPLTEGVAQAKNYAGKLAIRFTYATNGQGIYGIDMETGTEGELPRYPTPDELWNLTFAEPNAWRDRFAAVPFEDKGGSLPEPLLPGHRRRAGDGGHRRRASSASCSRSPPARARPSSPFRSPGNCSTAAGT